MNVLMIALTDLHGNHQSINLGNVEWWGPDRRERVMFHMVSGATIQVAENEAEVLRKWGLLAGGRV